MYLFYNGILIKKIKIADYKDLDSVFIRVVGHKSLFGSHLVGLVVKPVKLLKTDEKHKKIYFGTSLEMGADL